MGQREEREVPMRGRVWARHRHLGPRARNGAWREYVSPVEGVGISVGKVLELDQECLNGKR